MTTPPAGDPAQPPATQDPPKEDRLGRLEDKVDKLADAVARIVPAGHADAQQRTEARLDRPSSVEEQVQAELKRARDDEARARETEAAKSEMTQVKEELAKLKEKPPAEPRSRAARMLTGWG